MRIVGRVISLMFEAMAYVLVLVATAAIVIAGVMASIYRWFKS